ncbi:MAG: NAD(P)H-dependent oxidoreductase subunit E [Chlorobi bacterium]|nr:NAD(P)H-dependent oxidoreductase subunit E [Chlorobiota bacterium]
MNETISVISSSEHDQENIAFTEEELQRIEQIKGKYPEAQAAVMPLLWLAQKKWGWLSIPVLKHVAEVLSLPFSHVQGVASFYTMYWKRPMGRRHVQICTNISCLLRGGEDLYNHVSNMLEIGHMERTDDGEFSLEEVECMGACGGAPMIAINEDYYENVTIEEVEPLLAGKDEVE